MPETTKFWCLRNVEAFGKLNESELEHIESFAYTTRVKKRQALYLEGAEHTDLYILKQGAFKITKLSPEGKEIILDILKAGTIFGEFATGDTEGIQESAEAIEDSIVCRIGKTDFENIVKAMPHLTIGITTLISARKRKIENKLLSLVYSTVEQRLARTLLNLNEEFGLPHNSGSLLNLTLTHNDIAELIASTRETVTAVLSRFRSEGLIGMKGRQIDILSPGKLRQLAE